MAKNLFILIIGVCLLSCKSNKSSVKTKKQMPNVILIMADDMGYECLSSFGSKDYNTPILDDLAQRGVKFSNCVSQPLCTPSRVKIMTGMYNYRNYNYFGHLGDDNYTIGNLMKDAGYSTCIAGKWQLNGLAYKDEIKNWNDNSRPHHFGFDEYSLWQLTKTAKEGERFANPLIEQNGKVLARDKDAFGPDVFTNYILDFIERKKDQPFFVYYPMVMVHNPFVITPDHEDWSNEKLRYKHDPKYFKGMVTYTDKLVGKIMTKIKEHNLEENTLVMFLGDNGTNRAISTRTNKGVIKGAKGNTIDAGTHVPLLAYWPKMIKKPTVHDDLLEFSDFFPTLAEITGQNKPNDGKSFYNILTQSSEESRTQAFVHYNPKWGRNVNKYKGQFIRTLDYKLYKNGKFFHIASDTLERKPLDIEGLSQKQLEVYQTLKKTLDSHPNIK